MACTLRSVTNTGNLLHKGHRGGLSTAPQTLSVLKSGTNLRMPDTKSWLDVSTVRYAEIHCIDSANTVTNVSTEQFG
jgi:hypothetical protein